jgi:hypothetical protein
MNEWQKGPSPNMNMSAVMFLWNSDMFLPDYKSSHPRQYYSSQIHSDILKRDNIYGTINLSSHIARRDFVWLNVSKPFP